MVNPALCRQTFLDELCFKVGKIPSWHADPLHILVSQLRVDSGNDIIDAARLVTPSALPCEKRFVDFRNTPVADIP